MIPKIVHGPCGRQGSREQLWESSVIRIMIFILLAYAKARKDFIGDIGNTSKNRCPASFEWHVGL